MNRKDVELNPFSPEVIASPWEFFAQLRERAPVYALPNNAYYLVSRYQDVKVIALDTETYSSNLVSVMLSTNADNAAGKPPEMLNLSGGKGQKAQATDVLAIADPPQHTRQRRVANRAFTMRRVANMEQRIAALCHELLSDIKSEEFDWVKQFAAPLPLIIIMELIGFPLADREKLKRWSDASVALLSGINTAEELVAHGEQINQLIAYLAEHYDRAFESPGDNLLGDLIVESKLDDQQFGRDEIVSMLVQLLSAGNETTASLVGSGMLMLCQDQSLQHELRQNPDKISAFVEEVLRLESPFHGHFRLVKKDHVLHGVELKAGDRLMLMWSSTGRDAEQFEAPLTVKLDRQKPKSHLAFGYGIHHCIGAALSRAEARIAFETVLVNSKNVELNPIESVSYIPSLFIRSLEKLDIILHKT